MLRVFLISTALVMTPVALPAPVFAKEPKQAGKKCEDTAEKKRKRSMLGGALGSIAGGVLGHAGVPGVGYIGFPAAELLSEAILSLLDCKEQKQAAEATNEAVRGGVGTTKAWKSESRENVSGSSTVTAENQLADGSHCMTVTDVVIVDGEETTAPKRMCRKPGASGYVRV
jgi:hypothetical protein